MSEYHKAHPINYWEGKHLSEEHKKNIGLGVKGEKNGMFGKNIQKMLNKNKKSSKYSSDLFRNQKNLSVGRSCK